MMSHMMKNRAARRPSGEERGAMGDHDWAADPQLQPPFKVVEPRVLSTPLVFDSPHSGSRYPPGFLALSRLDPLALRRSEDAFVDELFLPCVGLGAPLLRAHFPRAFLDVNREPFELDPQMLDGAPPEHANTRSLRVAAGLGVIPRVVADAQPIYKARIPVADALARVAAFHGPYHERLAGLMARARARFGLAILVDCHSMPSTLAENGPLDVVLGDRFGASAAGWIVDALESALLARGYRVRRNKPYAGGHIVERHGAPARAQHAVQIEINRALYMDERAIVKTERAAALSEALLAAAEALVGRVVEEFGGGRLAAE
jgi:N-formylglutamate amidohydrolase